MIDWTFTEAIDRAVAQDDAMMEQCIAEGKLSMSAPFEPDISLLHQHEQEAFQAFWSRLKKDMQSKERKRQQFIDVLFPSDTQIEAARRFGTPWVRVFTPEEEREIDAWRERLIEVGAIKRKA